MCLWDRGDWGWIEKENLFIGWLVISFLFLIILFSTISSSLSIRGGTIYDGYFKDGKYEVRNEMVDGKMIWFSYHISHLILTFIIKTNTTTREKENYFIQPQIYHIMVLRLENISSLILPNNHLISLIHWLVGEFDKGSKHGRGIMKVYKMRDEMRFYLKYIILQISLFFSSHFLSF